MEGGCVRAGGRLDRHGTWPATSKLSKVFSGRVDPQTNREMELSGTRTIGPLHLNEKNKNHYKNYVVTAFS